MEHSELKAIALSNPEVKAAYDKLHSEFERLRELLKVRQILQNRRESIRNGSVQPIPGDEGLDQVRQLLNKPVQ